MRDWKALLAVPRFRALWIALLLANLGSWSVLAALPILVADRFGAGGALVLSLGWRILPKIVLAPVSGAFLRRFGAPRVAFLALVVEAALTGLLPWCEDFIVFQIVIAGIGALDVFTMPGLLSLRSTVTPDGMELASNSLCSMADRVGKTVGPALGGLAISAGYGPAFLAFAVAILLGSAPIPRLPRAAPAEAPPAAFRGWAILKLPAEVWTMLRRDRLLIGLLVSAVSYMVMLGGLRPFLFWANRDWFGGADAAWTGLMAAQGAGAVIGAVTAGTFNRTLPRRTSAYTLTMITSVIEGMFYLLLVASPSGPAGAWFAMGILALAGIPEVIAVATWFTVMQQRLSPDRQGLFLAFTAPLWDCAYAVGVMSAGLHAGGMLDLTPWWTVLALAATLPLLPLLPLMAWDSRRPAASV